jgi:ferredoxin-NADP reductase
MAALLTSSGRPGFYLRVLEEGYIGAGDEIVKLGGASETMTIEEINALLYSASHPRDRLERALTIDALAAGWRASFAALLQSTNAGGTSGNAGLAFAATVNAAAPGFRQMSVSSIERESTDVISFFLEPIDGKPLPRARAGQHVIVRLLRASGGPPLVRSYSLSGPPSGIEYRISVKVRSHGVAGGHLRDHVRLGDVLDVSAPHGNFVLGESDRPVVLLSAGIGATPVLAMLRALCDAKSQRHVLWIYATHDGAHHPFACETRHLLRSLAHGRAYICYSAPGPTDRMGEDFDAVGRLSFSMLQTIGIPPTADIYLCGPATFMDQMRQEIGRLSGPTRCIHTESFGGVESLTPGINEARQRAPHPPRFESPGGVVVYFARSQITARWKAGAYATLLELAEDCDVPVRWSCRTGVCHNCESGLVSGSVAYEPEPLDAPANGNLLLCCSRPVSDVVVDL